MLTISSDKVCFIVVKAREFDAKVPPAGLEEGSNPADDKDVEILEDQPDDTTQQELLDAIEGLNQDELLDLVALTWIGRGDFSAKEWDAARAEARDMRHKHFPSYLLETPLLSDYLEEGLSAMGFSCDAVAAEHL
ncbi:MAG TPA: DUF3775 domain-containing protein [Alphaproteobacteria bacterium]|jgi:hypothetical protein|nr:DUF3775 domain-containing protein [Alphaproteobacteria bacterium]